MFLKSKSQVAGRYWGPFSEESEVIFYDGELVQGVLDKAQFGAKGNGLVHSVFELYGPRTAGLLLSALGRLFTRYLQSAAFTCRMDDLILTKDGDKSRRDLLSAGEDLGLLTAARYVNMDQVNLASMKFKNGISPKMIDNNI